MKRLKKYAHLVYVVVLALSLMASVAPTVLADGNNYEGSFDILAFRDGDWQLQGALSFSDYETLQLPLDNTAGQLKLRLAQQGHDAAYIDYVAVYKDGTKYLPVSATNIDRNFFCVLAYRS